MKRRRRSGIAIVVAATVVACGQTSPSAPALPSPTTSAEASPSATASAPSSASPSAPSAAALEGASGPLAAGTYTSTSFKPRITFQLDDGWFVGSVLDGFFDVQQQQGTPDVVAVQFGIVEGVVGTREETVPAATAETAAQTIPGNPGLKILGESESRLGGLTGYTVEVENATEATVRVLDVPAGRLAIDPDRRLWVSVFDTSEGVLAVMVGGSVGDWEDALRIAEPVLESVVIENAS